MREAGREMSRDVVGIVRVGARFATCHSDAWFGNGRPSEVSAAGEGPAASILKGPVQFSESFSLRTLLSALFRNPWRIVAAVL